MNFALDGAPRYPALGDRTDQYRGFVSIAPSIEYLERAYDASKYGWYSERPYLDTLLPVVPRSRHGPSRQARDVVLRLSTRPTTSRAATGTPNATTSATRSRRTIESFFPGFGDLVLHREVVTPLDIERVVGLSEGNIYAGDYLLPQMYFFRPAPGWSQYRTPIDGYYQCGSGTHPGGCVTGAPARLASQQILKDRADKS